MKSMPGVNNGCQFLDSMAQIDKRFDRTLIVNGASHTNLDDVQSHLVNVPILRRDLGRIKVSLSAWDRALKDSIRVALVPAEEPVPVGKTQSGIGREMFSGTCMP
eukprot:1137819-Pelagomonas_calceolata.AAC.4